MAAPRAYLAGRKKKKEAREKKEEKKEKRKTDFDRNRRVRNNEPPVFFGA